MKFFSQFSIAVLSVTFVGCSDTDNTQQPITLLEAESLFTRSSSELQNFMELSGLDLPFEEIQYDVEVFKVTYKTLYKGEEITASGIVILPETNEPVGMLSFQHGTIAAHEEAPSALALSSSELIFYSALASPGFIAVIPDFIGFGSSKDIMHPYYVEELTASSIIDILKAAKELAKQQGLSFNKKLFLAGYSQGGYATMAAHKAIEEQGLSGFNLVASFPAAGGYDVKGMQETFFSLETYHEPFYLAYVARAYQTAYDWTQPLSQFFQEPYATAIPDLFDGTNTGGEINQELTEVIADFVQPALLSGIDTDPAYSFIVDAFEENSLLDWTPTKPMFMYHGTADGTVFYQNSIDTYDQLISNGASETLITFIPLPGADHGSGVGPYIEDFIPRLLAMR